MTVVTAAYRIGLFLLVCMSLLGTAAASVGITPSSIDEGVRDPGERFYSEFSVVSDADEPVSVTIDTGDGDIQTFERLKSGKADQFSAQSCSGCVDFLRAGGDLEAYDGEDVDFWRQIEFFVDVPDDAEPGYHLLELTPQPDADTVPGGVGLTATATVPLIYRVPGEVDRSGRLIGVSTGRRTGDRQHVQATFYNTGTATMQVDHTLTVNTTDGNSTRRLGRRTVAPGETATVGTSIDTTTLATDANDTFTAHVTADYHTGTATMTETLTVQEPGTDQAAAPAPDPDRTPLLPLIAAGLLLVVTTAITWRVIRG